MTVRVIYYTAEDLETHGDLELRRKSDVVKDKKFNYNDVFKLEELKHGWSLTPLNPAENPLFHNEEVISETTTVKNGFTFNSSTTFYKLIAEFPPAERSAKNKLFSILTAGIVTLILVIELLLVILLPVMQEQDSGKAQRVAVQRCENDINAIRGKLKTDKEKNKEFTNAAILFLRKELNRLTEYFRNNRDYMTIEEIELMRSRLTNYNKLADKLSGEIDFDQKVIPDVNSWIERNCTIEGK